LHWRSASFKGRQTKRIPTIAGIVKAYKPRLGAHKSDLAISAITNPLEQYNFVEPLVNSPGGSMSKLRKTAAFGSPGIRGTQLAAARADKNHNSGCGCVCQRRSSQ
jgi:hypothetical protein